MLTRWTRLGAACAFALGGFLVVGGFGASSGAQSVPPVTIEFPGADAMPDLSDDGSIVVFASADANGSTTIVVHDRASDVTTPIGASTGGIEPTVSGDGCTVAWSVAPPPDDPVPTDEAPSDPASPTSEPPTTDGSATEATGTTTTTARTTTTAQPADAEPLVSEPVDSQAAALQSAPNGPALFAVDRCAGGTPVPTQLVPEKKIDDVGPAAVSADGGVIVVSTGSELLRFERNETGYVQTGATRVPAAGPALRIDRPVDVSADGSVAVFAAGPNLADPAGLAVYRVERPDPTIPDADVVSIVSESATDPTVSGDGSIVVFTSIVADPPATNVTVRSGEDPPVLIAPGFRPAVSADGNHVVYETDGAVQVTSWIGQSLDPFANTQTRSLPVTDLPTRSRPAIDRLGATIATDAAQDADGESDISVHAVEVVAGFDADAYDLGAGDVGETLTSTLSFTNDGPASLGVETLAVDGTFTIVTDACSPVVRPQSTCTVDVSFTVEFVEEAFGTVTLTPVAPPADPAPYAAEVRAIGEAAPVVTTPPTTPGSTGGSTTGGSTSSGRQPTGGRTSTSGRTTSTTGSRTSATTTTTVAGAGLAFAPASFDFAPTIVDAGRRTGLVEFVNSSTESVSVIGVRLEPADDGAFEIVETDCAGESVPASGTCGVTVAFAPTTTGAQSVSLIASIDGGVEITASVNGVGAPPPTLEVIPGVARTGQVVTLRGAGFPTGLTVELTWATDVYDVAVDDAGTFAVPVVVMPHTRSGPATASVAGQQDQFGDVAATMLVTARSNPSQPGVLDGIGVNVGR